MHGIFIRHFIVEHVIGSALCHELKQFVCRQPTATLFEICSEAIRWEREGLPGGQSHSVPTVLGLQYGVKSGHQVVAHPPHVSELSLTNSLKASLACRVLISAVALHIVAPSVDDVSSLVMLPESVMGFVLLHSAFFTCPTVQPTASCYSAISKLAPAELQSHSSGAAATGSDVFLGDSEEVSKLMSPCPHLDLSMGGVSALLDCNRELFPTEF